MSRCAQAYPDDWQDRLDALVDEADTRRTQLKEWPEFCEQVERLAAGRRLQPPPAEQVNDWNIANGPTEEQVNNWSIANDHQDREVEA